MRALTESTSFVFRDYFHLKHIQPWTHYIPVRADLVDLEEKAAFVFDPANEDVVQDIITSANDWCRKHMVRRAIAVDYLDIFEVRKLSRDLACGWFYTPVQLILLKPHTFRPMLDY
jgi:hypothetical protein